MLNTRLTLQRFRKSVAGLRLSVLPPVLTPCTLQLLQEDRAPSHASGMQRFATAELTPWRGKLNPSTYARRAGGINHVHSVAESGG